MGSEMEGAEVERGRGEMEGEEVERGKGEMEGREGVEISYLHTSSQV